MKTTLGKFGSLCLGLATVAGLSPLAESGSLTAPLLLENSNVLPSGIGNPRLLNVFLPMRERYDNAGRLEPLAAPLNKQITWNDVISAQDDSTDQSLIEGTLAKEGVDQNGIAGETTGEINAYTTVFVPTLAFGITDKITFAAAVPVYHVDLRTSTGFVKSDDGQTFVNSICESDRSKCNEAAEKLNKSIPNKLEELGYQPIEPENKTSLGDIKLLAKILVWDTPRNRLALKPSVTLPTGVAPDADRVVEVTSGDGQFDVGMLASLDHYFPTSVFGSRGLWVNSYAGYVNQIADTIEKRIPEDENNTLSSDKEVVDRDLGNQYSAGASVHAKPFGDSLTGGFGYQFQYMSAGSFDGSKFSKDRYRLLSDSRPDQLMHSLSATLGFSTVGWYRNKKFFYPLEANLVYSRPLSGRNALASEVVTAELVLFF